MATNPSNRRVRTSPWIAAALVLLALASVSANSLAEGDEHNDVVPHARSLTLAQYRAAAMAQARNYDQTQDISPRQLLILLEVSERTGANLGQLLATGEFESAKTWNNFVRPTIDGGRLGSATGVWQFIPATFHAIIKRYGSDLIATSAADTTSGREHLDLSAGPFSDAQVRAIIQETVAGVRDADDESLQLLRHNFAVLAFAKHYLSEDTGASTPEEDYLFHFLGEKRGRQVLALARGEARHSLSVAPTDQAIRALAGSSLSHREPTGQGLSSRAHAILIPRSPDNRHPSKAKRGVYRAIGRAVARPNARADARAAPRTAAMTESSRWSTREIDLSQSPAADWALPADSPIVTGNPGMFYPDARDKRNPYTWAEFMGALSKRVQARQQPALVRAKYGVGFPLNGGDMPEQTRNRGNALPMRTLSHEIGSVVVSEQVLTGPLDAAETRAYKERIRELLRDDAAKPASLYSAPIVLALRNLGLVKNHATDFDSYTESLRDALRSFRALVGKAEPDDPALVDKVLPAEQVALAVYEQRVARYAALQFAQQAALPHALDLSAIRGLLKSHRRASKPPIAKLQKALEEQGLETQVRGSRRSTPNRFDGIAGKLTIGSLNRFQLSNGLRQTDGRLDVVTTALLGLPPLGSAIFLGPSGPFCSIQAPKTPAHCAAPANRASTSLLELLRASLESQDRLIHDRLGKS